MRKIQPGERFGKLTVIKDSGKRYRKHIIFDCLCDCGNTHQARSVNLTQGHVKSCGCSKHEKGVRKTRIKTFIGRSSLDKLGTKIGRLTSIDYEKELHKHLRVILQCECGNVVNRDAKEFYKGNIKSCGCLSRERSLNAQKKKDEIRQREELQRLKRHEYILVRDYTGQRFNKLTVLYFNGIHIKKNKDRIPLWYCECDCGNFIVKASTSLNHKSSCGCGRVVSWEAGIQKANEVLRAKYEEQLKHGWTSDRSRHKHRRKILALKRKVLALYNDVCIRCGKMHTKEDPLHIHHYRSYSKHPELRFLVVNNVPLCEECHDALHKILGFVDPPITKQYNYIFKKAV